MVYEKVGEEGLLYAWGCLNLTKVDQVALEYGKVLRELTCKIFICLCYGTDIGTSTAKIVVFDNFRGDELFMALIC